MRFKLEEDAPGKDCSNTPHYVITTKVRVNNETTVSLPTTSYVIIDEPGDQRLIVIDYSCRTQKVLNGLSQGLQLKLEKVGDDNKLALVTDSGEYYYYYHDGNIISIATIDFIPQSRKNGEYVHVYDYDTRSIKFKPLESSKVLIDPKDVISSKNMSLIGNRLDIQIGDNVFKESQFEYKFYKSIELHNFAGNKIGTLNNVVLYFEQENYRYRQVSLFPFNITFGNSYFTAKKLGHNYVGCISYENGECRRFYELNPDYFGYEHDNSLGPYPYYYNLENFGNFLEVDVVNTREFEDLKAEVQYLKEQVEQLRHREQVEGMPGPPGQKGEQGRPGSTGQYGLTGPPGQKGERGEKGQQGITSSKGERGEQGLRGLQGPVGPKGEDGTPGRDGKPASAVEIATELVTSKKAELGKAVLDAKGASGKNLATQVAGEVNISPQEFVNKVDPTKLAEALVGKLLQEQVKKIAEDIVSVITSDVTKKNNPDTQAFKKYEKFAERLAELLVDRSNMNKEEADALVKDKVSGWGLAKYLLLHSNLDGQEEARSMVGKEVDKAKLVEYLLEYARLKGDEDTAKTMVKNIANQFFDTKVDELGKAVLEVKDDQGKKILVNDKALQKGVAEELRKNPGKVRGPQGLPGPAGPNGINGQSGAKGDKGDEGNVGTPGTPGAKGDKGGTGLVGPKGFNGTQGEKGAQGDMGEIGAPGMDGTPGAKGDSGVNANPEEVAQRLINNGTIVNEVLEYRNQDGDLVLEQQIAGRLIYDQNIHAGIATELIDNKVQELADALLGGANDTLVEKLANSTELTKSISEELRKNPGKVQGPKGDQGDTGASGMPGPKGDKGDVGDKGNTGLQGMSGLKGDKGDIGPQGPKGVAGAQGVFGDKGDAGPKGDKGDMGTNGTPGKDGTPGMPGLKGEQGIPGTQGFNGTQGEKGDSGPTGPEGKQGSIGIPGPQGLNGTQGEKGDVGLPGMPGLKGDIGPIGPQGLPGLQGQKGESGVDGLKGDTGPKGDKGDLGPQGFNGRQGEKGDLGLKGDKGEFGSPGITGEKGDKGPVGLQGIQGLQGFNGTQGPVGPKGVDGAPGSIGPQGLPGLQGQKGESGVDGLKGEVGPQGIQGPVGSKGDMGTPGNKGEQGPQGPVGLKGGEGDTGLIGMPGPKGEDGIGADVANQFLHEIKKAKNETLDAKKAAEVAKIASEESAKEAQGAKEEVVGLNAEVKNMKDDTEEFADKALQSEQNAKTFYSKTKDIFCRTSPADQVCAAPRGKRETERKKYFNDQPATSGASRSSSWINVFANTIVDAVKGASQFIFSSFKPAIGYDNSQPSKAVTTQDVDINGILLLLDVFIRKITGQKYISTAEQPASPSETLGYSSQIAEEFERVLKYAAVRSGISVKNLSFNPVSVQSAIFQHINNGQYSKIPKSLYSFAKGAYPNYKQTDKFLAIFKDHMERALGSNEQPSNTKEIVTGSERPRSFMSDVVPPSSLSAINQEAIGYLR